MIKKLIYSLLIVIFQCVNADAFTLKGTLVNDSTKEIEPYATLKIVEKGNPTKAVKVFVSDESGNFKESVPATGNLILTATSIGFQELRKELVVKPSETFVDLGKLYIKPSTTMLRGVEIVAQKPLIKAELDKIAYNVEEDPDSKTNSVIEMLRKVPMVTVDGDDKIKVKGSSNFKVYVDGKPNNMMSQNASEVLKSMPATAIKKIEVITNPGIKYDAEGVGGILNIITNRATSMDGYTATLRGTVTTRMVSGGLYAMMNKGKFAMSLNYNYNYRKNPDYSYSSYLFNNGQITDNSYDLISNTNFKNSGHFQWGNLEASYDIDSLRLVSASFGIWGGDNDSKSLGAYDGYYPQKPDNKFFYYSLNNKANSTWYSINGSVDYQRLFRTKDRMLTFSYKIDTNPQTSETYASYDGKKSFNDNWNEFLNSFFNQYNKGKQSTTENTFQVDFSTPFSKIHTLEVGMKYILRNNTSNNDRYLQHGNETYTFDKDYSMHYRHVNNILGSYLGYGLRLGKWTGKTGVRYEYTYQSVKYKLGKGEDFNTHFNDIVPQLSIGYALNTMSNLRFGYNMRVQRPGIWYLNPYLKDTDPTNVSRGNPNLESEKNHSFELSYGRFSQLLSLNLSASYSFTDNAIQEITTYVNDKDIPGLLNPTGKNVMYTTYYNNGKNKVANFNVYVSWTPFHNTRLFGNFNTSYVNMQNSQDVKNSGWMFQGYGSIEQSFEHDWKINVGVFGNTKQIELQESRNGAMFYSIGVNKSFLKKKLTLSFSANNPFGRYHTFDSSRQGVGFITGNSTKFEVRDFRFTISYKFGDLKARVKKAARAITNDDVKSGSSQNGSMGGGQE